ncbi:hypothetical protein [Geodermatophilus sp. URMC 63]
MPAPSTVGAITVAAAPQREVFRIGEGRLAGTDAQAGILIAAAVAVVTFTGGLVESGDVDVIGLVATGVLAVVVTVLALHATGRGVVPRGQRCQCCQCVAPSTP